MTLARAIGGGGQDIVEELERKAGRRRAPGIDSKTLAIRNGGRRWEHYLQRRMFTRASLTAVPLVGRGLAGVRLLNKMNRQER